MNKAATALPSPLFPLPDLCHGRMVLRVLVLAQAVAILLAFAPGTLESPWQRLGLISLFIHWIALLSGYSYCKLRPVLSRQRPLTIAASCLLLLFLTTSVVSALAWLWLHDAGILLSQSFLHFILANLMIALVVGLMAIQLGLMHAERNQQLAAQSRAELGALQARIQPHFLFNSLNTAAELTQQDSQAAEQALLNLADLFRAAMHAGEHISLTEEITLARQYLALEQWRLGERMQQNWQLPASLPKLQLPALTIQPLLENAVRHGIESCQYGGSIDIELINSSQSVTIIISNPFLPALDKSRSNGVALVNIRQRLQLYFGDSASLTRSIADGKFRVKLVLPKSQPDSNR
ncbi:sensor histidine kinase [Arsukibacterium sp.]|uniref:sensor histidine kinase n=1 Tax=Arsukibacterium sp. TaxID=1977258 RepID=UPI00299EBD7F|nr:histidine kinase [Arsukibacterium sp.]MDX1538975.1 histidine kinase [Arsukibacterium sp.]